MSDALVRDLDRLLARAEKAEAAVERVVKLCANTQRRFDSSIKNPTAIASISVDAVLRAVDGDR